MLSKERVAEYSIVESKELNQRPGYGGDVTRAEKFEILEHTKKCQGSSSCRCVCAAELDGMVSCA